jgi:hypothetical protein
MGQDHDKKMCAMCCCPCNLDLTKIKSLAKEPKFICKACGRVANSEENLCQPEPLN